LKTKRSTFRGKPRGRPRKKFDPDSGRVRFSVRTPEVWKDAMQLCSQLEWEFTWFLEIALVEKIKAVRKRMRTVELTEAHLVRRRHDRPSNTTTESLRKLSKQPPVDDQMREDAKGWVQDYDEKMRGFADRFSSAGKKRN
jgi:hypothetical protein